MAKNKARFHFEQGLNFFHKEDYSQASTYFEEAIVEDPEYSEALYNLSCCCAMTGEKDKSLIYLSRAARLNPHCQDWAKEDREFNGLREDPIFKRIISGDSDIDVESANESSSTKADESAGEDNFQEAAFEQVERPEESPSKEETTPPQEPEADSSEPPPKLVDNKTAKMEPVKSDYPPCTRCEGLIDVERRPIFDPKISLAIIYVGVAMCCGLFFSFYGIIGIPIVTLGLYLFSRTEETWVCQNCGAKGSECGQKTEGPKV